MASIRKIEGKNRISYKIIVTKGRDHNGRQLRHYMTWTPDPKMTARQIEKAVQKAAFEFEQQIQKGFAVDNRQTFSEYARYVIRLKELAGKKRRTIESYTDLLRRIDDAIGHIKLTDLRPQHLNAFYENLKEEGIRDTAAKAQAIQDINAILKQKHFTKDGVAAAAGISSATVLSAAKGNKVQLPKAQAISEALGVPLDELFSIEKDTRPLTNKTVLEYHRFISTVLSQAEKEMIVEYNAAAKATPPKSDTPEAESFQLDEVERIRECLQYEPLKWHVATHLLLLSGCRRGEIAGLKWDHVDWQNSQIKIDQALLSSNKGGVYEDTTKTSTTRYIKLPQETMQLLKEYRTWYTEQRLLNGDHWVNSGYVFIKDNGQPMHPDSLTGWLAKFSKKYDLPHIHPHKFRHPYVKHTTKIFSLRLMNFQAQAYPDARRKTRGACQLHRGGQSKSLVRLLCNRKQFSCLPPQSKISRILYAISIRLSGYTSTRSISSSASSVVSVSASKIALDASLRLSCRACSSCFCFACANTAA